MKDTRFAVTYILMLILQLVLTKYCQIGPYIYISMLPAMVLCMPTARPTWRTMAAAFITGILVDGLADGPLGLNAAALIPVAALQKPVIRLVIDEDLVTRHYSFSFHQYGISKLATALCIEQAVYFAIYVIADGVGVRSFGFNLLKFTASFVVSLIFGLICMNILSPRPKR